MTPARVGRADGRIVVPAGERDDCAEDRLFEQPLGRFEQQGRGIGIERIEYGQERPPKGFEPRDAGKQHAAAAEQPVDVAVLDAACVLAQCRVLD